jgi:hypothetical protein
MFKILNFTVVTLLAMGGCGKLSSNEKKVTAIQPGSNAELISNPTTADAIDTINVAKIQFYETTFNFGKVKQGETVRHTFKFKNIGKVPLIITDTYANCGCTVAEFPKTPIKPGEESEITGIFDTKDKYGGQDKFLNVMANTIPNKTTVLMTGEVLKPGNKK